ncbi:OmpA family protein [Brevundimonas goettingensis]|uniref:OmpA family protein n=1 Tax=Brevundimonas goettingensis TaxID=2774190 RepID=A0A975GUS2_9CAUL|nr:OmpA family protein [Brevundimonas goettingensis]QTC89783.1 OmpA family protein [Brevundimonas goettingensis]
MGKRTLSIAAAVIALLAAFPTTAHEYVDYFASGETHLSATGYRVAREVAAYAAQAPSRIVITAHEDGLEAATYADEQLDLWRAREMMLELMRLGVSPWIISIQTRGDTRQARYRPGAADEPLNRRVTVDIDYRPPPEPFAPTAPYVPGAPPPTPPRVTITEPYRPWISFEPGQSEVTREGEYRLRLGTFGCAPGACRIFVRGHTDTIGTPEDNLALSELRAQAVARALVRQGMIWDDLRVEGYGETQLVRPSADEVAEPLNRRVTVDVVFNPVRH